MKNYAEIAKSNEENRIANDKKFSIHDDIMRRSEELRMKRMMEDRKSLTNYLLYLQKEMNNISTTKRNLEKFAKITHKIETWEECHRLSDISNELAETIRLVVKKLDATC